MTFLVPVAGYSPEKQLPSFGRTFVDVSNARSILTPASGFMRRYKFTLNPYSGCSFGCEYCYARFFVPSLAARETWGEWVTIKANAAELMEKACRSGALNDGDPVYMSSVTDPYQPIERRTGLTRLILQTMLDCGVQPRLTVQTRSPLVSRDIDFFRAFRRIRVNLTINTDSDSVRRRYEPRCPSIPVRVKAARELVAAGVRIGVSISPMLPIENASAFGATLADLNADEYVTQYLKPGQSRFAAGSGSAALQRASEDGWGLSEYKQAREVLATVLGRHRPLLEGAEGYAPA
jgi:DNA repair photolyase